MRSQLGNFPSSATTHESETRIERDTVKALVKQGTKTDALKFALSCNTTHGLRRTNADKQQAIGLAITEWPRLSNGKIAEICAVDDQTVGAVRARLENFSSQNGTEIRIGRDGREYRVPQMATSPPQTPPATPDEDPPRVRTADEQWTQAVGGDLRPSGSISSAITGTVRCVELSFTDS